MTTLAFTGTRRGMTVRQKRTFREYLKMNPPTTFLHGACEGADRDAHLEVQRFLLRYSGPFVATEMFPSDEEQQQWAWDAMQDCPEGTLIHQIEALLLRNRRMVDHADLVLACPHGLREYTRSGTWATVRYARRLGKPYIVVGPSGLAVKGETP